MGPRGRRADQGHQGRRADQGHQGQGAKGPKGGCVWYVVWLGTHQGHRAAGPTRVIRAAGPEGPEGLIRADRASGPPAMA